MTKMTATKQELVNLLNGLFAVQELQGKHFEKLEEENKEVVQVRRTQMEAVQLMMEDELEVNIHTISEDIIPEDMTAKQINNIIKILV